LDLSKILYVNRLDAIKRARKRRRCVRVYPSQGTSGGEGAAKMASGKGCFGRTDPRNFREFGAEALTLTRKRMPRVMSLAEMRAGFGRMRARKAPAWRQSAAAIIRR
jgi:hypothetical protein